MIVRSLVLTAILLTAPSAWAEEICRYAGTTSHAGEVTVRTRVSASGDETTVDVAAWLSARSFGLINWRYLYQEISVWRADELRSVAVNHRYSVAGTIRRQQWDVFNRAPDGMIGYRVQAKTLSDFQAKHAGFVRYWDPATFGQNWVPDYESAGPERRADLDLPRTAVAPALGTPMALAFYWVRWSDQKRRDVTVILPGFKKNAQVDLQVNSLGVEAGGLLHVRTAVRHPQLSETETSTGDAWVSSDHRLARVAFEAHGDHGSARGELRLQGCQGDPSAR
jgi:hypothetical protein